MHRMLIFFSHNYCFLFSFPGYVFQQRSRLSYSFFFELYRGILVPQKWSRLVMCCHVSVICPWRCRNVNSSVAGIRTHVAVLTAVSPLPLELEAPVRLSYSSSAVTCRLLQFLMISSFHPMKEDALYIYNSPSHLRFLSCRRVVVNVKMYSPATLEQRVRLTRKDLSHLTIISISCHIHHLKKVVMHMPDFPRLLPFGLAHNCVEVSSQNMYFLFCHRKVRAMFRICYFNSIFLSASI